MGEDSTHPARIPIARFPEGAQAPPPDPALVQLSGPGRSSLRQRRRDRAPETKQQVTHHPRRPSTARLSTSILSPALLAPHYTSHLTSPHLTSPAAAWGSGGSRSVCGKSGVQGRKKWRRQGEGRDFNRGAGAKAESLPRKHRIGGCDSPAKNTKACEYLRKCGCWNEEHHIPCAPTSAHHSEHVSQRGA